MKRFKQPLSFLLTILPYLTVFIFALYTPSDPDLGWHLRYGEYFFQHGSLLRDNSFSSMMPSFQWANTSWLTDVLTYAVFFVGGFLGLTLLSSGIVTATFFFFSRVAKLSLWDQAFLFPVLLYLVQPVNAISFRGQQISLLFIGILLYIVSFYPKKPKVLLFTIPLFFLWANLHGQFIFGLALFAGWIGFYILLMAFKDYRNAISSNVIPAKAGIQIKTKMHLLLTGSRTKSGMTKVLRQNIKEFFFLFLIFIASILVTIINPFGIGIHSAALSHFGSPLLENISEYLPFAIQSQEWWNQIIVVIGIVMGSIFLFFKGKLVSRVPRLGISLVVFALSFGVRRFAWPAYYMILPLLQPLAGFLKPDNKRTAQIMTTIFLIILFAMAVITRYPFAKYYTYDWNDYCRANALQCSPKAAEFMLKHNLTSDLYTLYGWGGWLIWQYPEIKPLIDGRMHLWKDKNGYSGFVDYYDYEQNFKDIDKSRHNTVLITPDKPVYDRLEELASERKWKKAYEDDYAAVFVRIKKNL